MSQECSGHMIAARCGCSEAATRRLAPVVASRGLTGRGILGPTGRSCPPEPSTRSHRRAAGDDDELRLSSEERRRCSQRGLDGDRRRPRTIARGGAGCSCLRAPAGRGNVTAVPATGGCGDTKEGEARRTECAFRTLDSLWSSGWVLALARPVLPRKPRLCRATDRTAARVQLEPSTCRRRLRRPGPRWPRSSCGPSALSAGGLTAGGGPGART